MYFGLDFTPSAYQDHILLVFVSRTCILVIVEIKSVPISL